ncbi:MAG TPA: hypothetical protein VJ765_10660 [Chitinophagaceae bacterium]|nr:hypothetical protein [Chitinophagaceae bacterium]
MNHDKLFLETLNDIRAKMNGSDYELIRACGLLRHLLINGGSLLGIVNRKYRLKIHFAISDKTPPDNYLFAYWTDISYLKEGTKQVSIDGLLSSRILTFVDMNFTVLDIIKAGSHVQGGIHSGVPESDNEKFLSVLDDKVFKEQYFGMKSIKAICSVVLSGLEPLEDLISGHTPADRKKEIA